MVHRCMWSAFTSIRAQGVVFPDRKNGPYPFVRYIWLGLMGLWVVAVYHYNKQ